MKLESIQAIALDAVGVDADERVIRGLSTTARIRKPMAEYRNSSGQHDDHEDGDDHGRDLVAVDRVAVALGTGRS